MKIIFTTFKVLIAMGMMVFGLLLIPLQFEEVYGYIDRYYEQFLEQLPPGAPVREIVAGAIALVGMIMILSMLFSRKKERSISFAGMHGEVSIELDHVESTLEAVAMKLPEVRKATVRLEPTDSPGRACVIANVELLKNADDDARLVTARVQHYIQLHTKKILGLNDVEVRLNVKRFKMIMKTLKLEPLLLEGPFATAAGIGAMEAAAAEVEEETGIEEEALEVGAGDSGDKLQAER